MTLQYHDPFSGCGSCLYLIQEPPFITALDVASVYNKGFLNKLGCCGRQFPCQIYGHSFAADVGELWQCQTREARVMFRSFLWGYNFCLLSRKNGHQILWKNAGHLFPPSPFSRLMPAIKLPKISQNIIVHENFSLFPKGWRLKAKGLMREKKKK